MILLTGFEPFGGEAANPSWEAVQRAGRLLRGEGYDVEWVELPCAFGAAAAALDDALDKVRPAVVVCTGLAGGRAGISLERVAINCEDAAIPDNAGRQPVDEEVVAGGPAAYFTSLPIKAALHELRLSGIRAEVSQSAGTYVCNHVFYSLMHRLSTRPGVRGGFVHVPYADTRSMGPGHGHSVPSMSVSGMAEGIAVVVRTALNTAADEKLGAGALN